MGRFILIPMCQVSRIHGSARVRCTELANLMIGFETIVVNYGTDIPNLKGDHKRYLYGPGSILMAHSDHEHLSVSDLKTAVEGYKTLIQYSLK